MTKAKKTKPAKGSAAPSTPAKALNAAQRISALEGAVAGQDEKFNILADEIDRLRSLTESLAKRLNATIDATDSEDKVTNLIVQDNIKELEGKINFLVGEGVLEKNNEGEIEFKSFVVGRDLDENGKVVNPRYQFAVPSIQTNLFDQIKGKKVGDKFSLEGLTTTIEIMEIYKIKEPDEAEKNFDEETSETPEA